MLGAEDQVGGRSGGSTVAVAKGMDPIQAPHDKGAKMHHVTDLPVQLNVFAEIRHVHWDIDPWRRLMRRISYGHRADAVFARLVQ